MTRLRLARDIKAVVQQQYRNFHELRSSNTECCSVTESSTEYSRAFQQQVLVFKPTTSERFRDTGYSVHSLSSYSLSFICLQVNLNDMCHRRGLGLSSDDARYPTDFVLQEFRQNIEDIPDVKFQFFGLQDGLTVIYPSSAAPDCSTYDNRLRLLSHSTQSGSLYPEL